MLCELEFNTLLKLCVSHAVDLVYVTSGLNKNYREALLEIRKRDMAIETLAKRLSKLKQKHCDDTGETWRDIMKWSVEQVRVETEVENSSCGISISDN